MLILKLKKLSHVYISPMLKCFLLVTATATTKHTLKCPQPTASKKAGKNTYCCVVRWRGCVARQSAVLCAGGPLPAGTASASPAGLAPFVGNGCSQGSEDEASGKSYVARCPAQNSHKLLCSIISCGRLLMSSVHTCK